MNLNFYTKATNLLVSPIKSLVLSIICLLSMGSVSAQVGATGLNFDGVNDYIVTAYPVNSALNISSAITIEAWINPTKSTGVQDVLSKSNSDFNNSYIFPRTSDGWRTIEFLINIYGYGWKVLKVPYGLAKLNQWHHVAATYDGLRMRMYIDGVKSGEIAFAGFITTNNNVLSLGNHMGFSEFYGGSIDEVRVWNRALTGCEISNNLSCQLNVPAQNGLVVYYQCNQGFVNLPNTGITTLNDSGPNGINGTLINFGLTGLLSNWVTGTVSSTTCALYIPPVITAGALQNTVPLGGTISLTASSSVPGSTYSWAGPNGFTSTVQNPVLTGVSSLASGTYTVTVMVNGCPITASTDITVAYLAGGLNFDGLDDNITVPYNTSLAFKTFTVEAWINPSQNISPVQNVVSTSSRFEDNGFEFPKTYDGWKSISFNLSIDNTWKTVTANFPASALGQWNHVAATYDGYFMKIYINGVLLGILEVYGSYTANTNDFTIGNRIGLTQYYKGSLDELRIWNRAQSQCEIINNMNTCELNGANNGLALQTGLASYYRFNQGLKGADNSAFTTLADSSGHSNNGKLNNFALNGTGSNWVDGKVNGLCSFFPLPLLSASANGTAFQIGSNVKLFANNGNNGIYKWDGPNVFSTTIQNPVINSIQPNQAGTYTVTTPYTNCVVTASTRVSITTAPLIIPNGPTSICPNGSVTLSTPGIGSVYQWYKNDTAISGANTNQYIANKSGIYTVTITNGAEVTVSAGLQVTVIPDITAPVPNIPILPSVTIGIGSTLTAIPTATDDCRGVVIGTPNRSLTFNTTGTFTIIWTYDDLNGNKSTQNQQVIAIDTVPPVLTLPANISTQATLGICAAAVSYSATATDNSGLPVTITYSINPGSTFPIGNTIVTVKATDASNNSTSGTFTVTITPIPVAPITGNKSVCLGSTTSLFTTTAGGTWSSNNSAVASISTGGVVTGQSVGSAFITYTDACGSTASTTVTVIALPGTPVISVVDNCATSTLSTTATGTLLWSTNATTASISVSTAGTYSVTQTINGCTSAAGFAVAAPIALPATPVVTVVNNCESSILSTNVVGALTWSTGATTSSITVYVAGTYTVTQTVNGCTSLAGSGIAAPNTTPAKPVVTVADNCGSSMLSTNATGTLAWSNGATTSSITVTGAGIYTVTQTVNGCVSAAGSGTASPRTIPATPVVTVVNNCGSSILSTDATGTLAWSNGVNTSSITVNTAGSYTVTQTVNGCTSVAGSGIASPLTVPSTPVVTVVNNCGSSTLSTNAIGTLAWSNGANTSSITVNTAGTYTVTAQSANGCTSVAGSGIAAPKPTVAAPAITVVNNCGSTTLSTNASGTLVWSNAGTTSSINVTSAGTYSVTVTNASGCSASSSVAVTVNTAPVVNAITGTTTVTVGSATQLANATTGGVWTSSNTAVAAISTSGLVTGVGAGSSTITYTVTGTGGCTATVTAMITVTPSCVTPVFTTIGNITTSAVSGCAAPVTYTINVTGTPALTYTLTGATAGTGSGSGSGTLFNFGITNVTINAVNACGTATTYFTVTVINANPLTATITPASADVYCNSLVLTGTNGASAYKWVSPGGSTYSTNAQINLGLLNADGIYQLFVSGANGCTGTIAASYNYQKQNLINSYAILATSYIQLGDNNTIASGSVGVITPGNNSGNNYNNNNNSGWGNNENNNDNNNSEDDNKKNSRNIGSVTFGNNNAVISAGSFVKASIINKNGYNINISNQIYSAASGITLPTMYYNTANTSGLSSVTVNQGMTTVLNGNYKNLTLKKGSVTTLNGTVFGSITIEQGAKVSFTAATVNIDKLKMNKGPRYGYTYVRFSQNTKVLVRSSVNVSSNCFINPDNKNVTFYMGDPSPYTEKFTVTGGDTKINANVYLPKGIMKVTGGYRYGDYGGGNGDCDRDDDDDKYYGQGNSTLYMTGFYIADQVTGYGKNVTWNTFDCSAAPVALINTSVQQASTASTVKESSAIASEEELRITVMPNPSTTFFTLKFESKYETPVSMRVMDVNGRVIDAKIKIGSNSTIQIGSGYASGTYYAEMIQGSQRKVIQLMKIK